jgi:hypothetical protein
MQKIIPSFSSFLYPHCRFFTFIAIAIYDGGLDERYESMFGNDVVSCIAHFGTTKMKRISASDTMEMEPATALAVRFNEHIYRAHIGQASLDRAFISHRVQQSIDSRFANKPTRQFDHVARRKLFSLVLAKDILYYRF